MSMKKQLPVFLIFAFGAMSCADMTKDPYELDSDSLKFGVIASLTGSLATFGRSMFFGIELAAQEINDAGGVNGQKIELIRKDDKLNTGVATQSAHELVNEGVVGVIGSLASSMTLAVANNVTIAANIPLISGASTSPVISELVDNNTVWRTVTTDAFQGKFLAEKVKAAGASQASVIYVDNAYGKGLAARFDEVFTSLGGTVLAKVGYTEGKSKDFGTEVTQILNGLSTGDAVMIFGYEIDSAAITTEIAAHTKPELTYWGCDGNYSPSFLKNANIHVARKMRGSAAQSSSGTNYMHFVEGFEGEVQELPTQYTENVYDALYLMALAMAQAGTNTSQAIIDNLIDVSKDNGNDTVINPGEFAKAVDLLHAGQAINYEGASGNVNFTAEGDVVANFTLWKVNSDGSGFETVE